VGLAVDRRGEAVEPSVDLIWVATLGVVFVMLGS
jgi:hypothetical protein